MQSRPNAAGGPRSFRVDSPASSRATGKGRMRHTAAPFHALGLCRRVVIYRPNPDPRSGVAGCREAHRTVAAPARAQGAAPVLVFEGDVLFDRLLTPRGLRPVAAAPDDLPAGWMRFCLGHWPRRMCPLGRRARPTSPRRACARIASRRLRAGPGSVRGGRTMSGNIFTRIADRRRIHPAADARADGPVPVVRAWLVTSPVVVRLGERWSWRNSGEVGLSWNPDPGGDP